MGWAQNVPTTHTNTSNECYCYPCSLKIAKFYRQGESETLSLKICLLITQHHKFSNYFATNNTMWGIAVNFPQQISHKQTISAIAMIIEIEFCCL